MIKHLFHFLYDVGLCLVISTTNYLTETRQKVMALNLAKEGVEIVYNIRNTNWRRRYEQKDACWLNANPFAHAA